ncbi:hypothetical protein H4R19_007220, partial [Coemansia spiralis]
MPDPRAHFTEPSRQRADGAAARHAGPYGSYGPSASPLGSQSLDIVPTSTRGCVPTHRSVFRLFRRKAHMQTEPSQSELSGAGAGAGAGAAGGAAGRDSASTSVTGEHGGYLRSRKGTRGTTLSAQRTRSDLAVAGPAPAQEHERAVSATTAASAAASAAGGGRTLRPTASQGSTRLPKTDRGTIVPLGSSLERRVSIPSLDGVHADVDGAIAVGEACVRTPARVPWAVPAPRSASSADVSSLLRGLEADADAERQTASDDELLAAEVTVHVSEEVAVHV